jgi:hypothetical protein
VSHGGVIVSDGDGTDSGTQVHTGWSMWLPVATSYYDRH